MNGTWPRLEGCRVWVHQHPPHHPPQHHQGRAVPQGEQSSMAVGLQEPPSRTTRQGAHEGLCASTQGVGHCADPAGASARPTLSLQHVGLLPRPRSPAPCGSPCLPQPPGGTWRVLNRKQGHVVEEARWPARPFVVKAPWVSPSTSPPTWGSHLWPGRAWVSDPGRPCRQTAAPGKSRRKHPSTKTWKKASQPQIISKMGYKQPSSSSSLAP